MAPEKARLFLPSAEVLVICKLTQDHWAFSSQGGKGATFDSPHSTNIEKRYIHVKPEQIWVIDGSTGDVIRKFSATGTVPSPLKKYPLVVKLFMKLVSDDPAGLVYATVDDGIEELAQFNDKGPVFYADKKVQLRWSAPPDLSRLFINVNGVPYVPKWQRTTQGSLLREASTEITISN